jgi:hypothetical protein
MRLMSRAASLFFMCLMLTTVTGCASGGFTGALTNERADLTAFAEFTVVMMGQADFGLTRDDTRLIREYIDLEDPRYATYESLSSEVGGLIDNLVDYSVNVASLSESLQTEAEVVAAYATYLEQFKGRIVERTSLSEEEFEQVVANVRQQEVLLDALRSAQPAIDQVIRFGDSVVEQTEELLLQVASDVEKAIDADYASVLRLSETLEDRKDRVADGLTALDRYQSGDAGALDDLRTNPVLAGRSLVPEDGLDLAGIDSVDQFLVARLKHIRSLEADIANNLEEYRGTHGELDEIYGSSRDQLARIRTALIAWATVHHKMSKGVTDPAKWLEALTMPLVLYDAMH